MVEDRITDPRRIAQLLSSELTGLAAGPLASVSVESADRDAEPEPGGRFAFEIDADGHTVGSVHLHEDGVELRVADRCPEIPPSLEPPADGDIHEFSLWLGHGAAVKRAVDVLADHLDERAE